ncbi:MAG: flagellar biosynthetic protein FliO [Candidatus Neomarinimicrobiota bacterium]
MKVVQKNNLQRIIALVVVVTIAVIGINMRGRAIRNITQPPPVTVDTTAIQPLALEPYATDGLASALVKTVFITLVILVVIILGARGLRQLWGRRLTPTSVLDMQILGRQYFNPKQSIALVKVRDRELLVGITDHTIQLLCDLTPDRSETTIDEVTDMPTVPPK